MSLIIPTHNSPVNSMFKKDRTSSIIASFLVAREVGVLLPVAELGYGVRVFAAAAGDFGMSAHPDSDSGVGGLGLGLGLWYGEFGEECSIGCVVLYRRESGLDESGDGQVGHVLSGGVLSLV